MWAKHQAGETSGNQQTPDKTTGPCTADRTKLYKNKVIWKQLFVAVKTVPVNDAVDWLNSSVSQVANASVVLQGCVDVCDRQTGSRRGHCSEQHDSHSANFPFQQLSLQPVLDVQVAPCLHLQQTIIPESLSLVRQGNEPAPVGLCRGVQCTCHLRI